MEELNIERTGLGDFGESYYQSRYFTGRGGEFDLDLEVEGGRREKVTVKTHGFHIQCSVYLYHDTTCYFTKTETNKQQILR